MRRGDRFVACGLQIDLVEIESEMKFGFPRPVGLDIVDIDGCLRSTDETVLTPADVHLLQGVDANARVTCEFYDEYVVLGKHDHVRLDETR